MTDVVGTDEVAVAAAVFEVVAVVKVVVEQLGDWVAKTGVE